MHEDARSGDVGEVRNDKQPGCPNPGIMRRIPTPAVSNPTKAMTAPSGIHRSNDG
jgi:hypothetical protein